MPSKPTHANASVHVSSYPDGGTTYPTKNGSKTIIAPQSAVGSPSIHNSDHLEGLERKTRAKMGHATENFAPASKGHLPEPRADAADTAPVAGTVNRKKQKRRQKQAAKEAAEKAHTGGRAQVAIHENGQARNRRIPPNSFSVPDDPAYAEDDFDDPVDFEGDGLYYSDEDGRLVYGNPYGQGDLPANGHGQTYDPPGTLAGKKSKKRRREKLHQGLRPHLAPDQSPLSPAPSATQAPPPPPPPPPLSATSPRPTHTISRDRIWNTSTQEERERIKEFWLSLSEEERRSLVKVEKEAVLRKMKEQQKHSCSCTVCGRKRTAIEEELEVLYDAYYEELEQYANHQQSNPNSGAPIMSPPRGYDHLSHMDPSRQFPPGIGDDGPPKGRVEELPDDEEEEEEDDDDDEDFSDDVEEEDDEEYSDEDLEPENRGPAADFFNFGNSLTVQGGILTVADDLLKNDGKKFIEMMEQLAERRMQREEEAQTAAAAYAHPSLNLPGHHAHAGHNHPPLPEEEEYDEEEEDEEYDSQDDEYDDEEMVGLKDPPQ
ncbi:MAG: Stress response protein nst1 [Phylliscum demangeonii]|nr:MAG: Stress response protein nst1 [Phylliscum demangeonii]